MSLAIEVDPVLIDAPMPIRTPRLLIRPKQPGDGVETAAAVSETWNDLHRWMAWAENLADHTVERMEIRSRRVMASFLLREEFNLMGIEIATAQPVIWCGFHSMDWKARQCETGFWVRKSAQRRGFATESTNALLRYAFGALGCGVSESPIPVAMRLAAGLSRSSGFHTKVRCAAPTYCRAAALRIAAAMCVWTLPTCLLWTCSGEARYEG